MKKRHLGVAGFTAAAALAFSLAGCAGQEEGAANETSAATSSSTEQSGDSASSSFAEAAALDLSSQKLADADVSTSESFSDATDDGHAIIADATSAQYSAAVVQKTGDSSGDEADFYGENASVFATNGATLDLSNLIVGSDGTHANGVFSYGSGTTANISHSIIRTAGNCSGGLMTTGGATMNATDVTADAVVLNASRI